MILSKRNSELTDQKYDALKKKCSIKNSSYYGTKLFNYVTSDKRFKRTVFGSQIKELFNYLLDVRHEPFEERNLSTTVDKSRINGTKRVTPLVDTKSNNISYINSFKVNFKKALLLVNGLKKPIVLA